MDTKKYKLTEETIAVTDRILYRIEALKDFNDVKQGDKGGFIENEKNLSQSDDCWVYDNAEVFGEAKVHNNAKVYDNAKVSGNAVVFGDAEVCGNAEVCDNAEIRGNAIVANDSDYIVFRNWWSSGRYFTWTKSNNMWKVGCFYGSGRQLINKAYMDSELSGTEYERIVRYIEKDYPEIIKNQQ